MSIINQMLKDIDQRDRDQLKRGRRAAHYADEVRQPRPMLWASLGGLLAVIVVVGVYYSWQLLQADNSTGPGPRQIEQLPQLPVTAVVTDEAGTDPGSADSERTNAATSANQAEERARPRSEGGRSPSRPQVLERGEALPTELASANTVDEHTSAEAAPEPESATGTSDEDDSGDQNSGSASNNERVAEPGADTQDTQTVPQPISQMSIERSEMSPEGRAERMFDQAMEALQQNNHRQAEQRLHEVLLVDPEHSEARQQLAAHYYGRGFLSDAMEVLEAGLVINEKDYDLLLLQARIYESVDEPRRALEAIRDVPYELPELVDLLILKGSLALDLEEYPLAANTYQALTGWRSHQGRWWLGLAMAREELAEYERAEHAYQRALSDGRLPTEVRDFILDRLEALTY